MCAKSLQSSLFVTPMDCSPPDFSVHGISQARILEWVAISYFRRSSQPRIEPSLLHCRQILYCLSPQGSPRILEWVAYPFSRGSSRPRNPTRVSPTLQADSLPAELPGKPIVSAKLQQNNANSLKVEFRFLLLLYMVHIPLYIFLK